MVFPESYMSKKYGMFTEREVINTVKELKRDTAAGVDKIKIQDLKCIPISHVAAIMNNWWCRKISDTVKHCPTTLLPKEDHLEEVESLRPMTVGNKLMRVQANLWDKQLRLNIELDETQKGFIPVDSSFENLQTLQQVIKQQRTSNIVKKSM